MQLFKYLKIMTLSKAFSNRKNDLCQKLRAAQFIKQYLNSKVAILCFFALFHSHSFAANNSAQSNILNKQGLTEKTLPVSEHALTKQDISLMLNRADKLRSSNNAISRQILEKLKKQAFLTLEQRNFLTYLTAIQAGFEGDYSQIELLLTTVIKSEASDLLKYRANYSLINLYTEQERWRDGLKQVETLLNIESNIEQHYRRLALMAVTEFYIQLEQYSLAYKYSLQVIKESTSPRNICIAKQLQVAVKLKSSSPLLKEDEVVDAINACEQINEQIFLGYIRLYQGEMYLNDALTSKAINATLPYIEDIVATNYYPLIGNSYRLIAEIYWQQKQYRKAKNYAFKAQEYFQVDTSLKDKKAIFYLLFQLSELEEDYIQAFEYHKLYDEANSELIKNTQEKHLVFQLVQHNDLANKNKIAQLNKTNTFLKTQHEITLEKEQTIILIVMILVGLLTLGSSWVYNSWLTQQKLRQIANFDSLTGATSRGHFFELAELLLQEQVKFKQDLSCIIFDLDHFKQINDTYGHAIGDKVLTAVATVCQEQLRHQDLLGRLGGEEFAIILPDFNLTMAEDVANRCRIAIHNLDYQSLGLESAITASFGVSDKDISGENLTDLLADADSAMYSSKQHGRNCTVTYR
ncbi:GGDEF domain-containing protein [Litorilituus lipolyticus]|nr:GGDEF domain-containing protein [Litorilituus lipolyticus]